MLWSEELAGAQNVQISIGQVEYVVIYYKSWWVQLTTMNYIFKINSNYKEWEYVKINSNKVQVFKYKNNIYRSEKPECTVLESKQ
jgi:hypothetical protein